MAAEQINWSLAKNELHNIWILSGDGLVSGPQRGTWRVEETSKIQDLGLFGILKEDNNFPKSSKTQPTLVVCCSSRETEELFNQSSSWESKKNCDSLNRNAAKDINVSLFQFLSFA